MRETLHLSLPDALLGHETESAGQPDALQTLRELQHLTPARERLECAELAPALAPI